MIRARLTRTGRWSQLAALADCFVMFVALCPAETMRRAVLVTFRLITLATVVTVVASCAPPAETEERLVLKAAAFDDLLGWGKDNIAEVIPALLKSCAHFENLPIDRQLGDQELGIMVGDLHKPCQAAAMLRTGDHQAARTFFEKWFLPFSATNNGDGEGLFTGYFEVGLEGRLTADNEYKVPPLPIAR